ncbi:unnamed protein product [Notodromas monacha]|uniref:Solute carrier family 23 member 2 n=1 Tax=Notodromas monacha TaxID=399045 RepID=A0A7R9BNL6_9CRUS|nr:unnamed protein product [Notodromas monacha]CAG0917446.1 unnamed protein product [Notodromas monacha]
MKCITGAVGFILRFITPVSVVPLVALVGLSLFDAASASSSKNWGLACITMALIVVFSQYLRHLSIPVPSYDKETRKFRTKPFPLFELLPIILAILASWLAAFILTATDVIPEGNPGRTDSTIMILRNSPWFRLPYPGQWGTPVITTAGVLGMVAAILSSVVESIGDYYACARLCNAPSPPVHAINRGIGIEGVGSVFAALFGTSTGTTSYSENIGAIGISKVGSRRVILCAGVLMMICGVVSKLGAVFVMIPEPIIGGIFCTLFGVIAAVGLSNLQFVDLNSTRNIFILGFSLFMGLVSESSLRILVFAHPRLFAVPKWMQANSGKNIISTGLSDLDSLLTVLLSTSMFVGGGIAFFLDNTVPGTFFFN